MRMASLAAVFCLAAGALAAQEFPLVLDNKFGRTVIESRPERVATVDFAGADDLLALGIQPVTIRDWYGGFEHGLWPWAAGHLRTDPQILRGEINYEQIAGADPDVILALWSGIGAADYERLSRIAPVVAVPEGMGDFSLPWDQRALLVGRATGREAEAEAAIARIRKRMDDIATAHPDWQGRTASVAFYISGNLGAYTAQDVRVQLLARLGLVPPDTLTGLAGWDGGFSVTLSEEALSVLEADLILWTMPDGDLTAPERVIMRPYLGAVRSGREVLAGKLLTGAMSHASLLSLPWALDRLEPAIEAALVGRGPVAVE